MARAPVDPRVKEILSRLRRMYPDAVCALDFVDPYQLLTATILAAQSTDRTVNTVTPELFRRYPNPAALAAARIEEIEGLIHPTGFFRNKARSILGAARAIVEDHDGSVPSTMEELVELPGVGRKTANVVLGNAFGINAGIVVDTHVRRVSQRLALTQSDDPVVIEQDLIPLVPRKEWTMFSHRVIDHGRTICHAKRPLCEECALADLCPSSRVETGSAATAAAKKRSDTSIGAKRRAPRKPRG